MENEVTLDKIISGGQAIGTLESGKKVLLWGGLPGEKVEFRTTKKKSKLVEGVVTKVLSASEQRIAPEEPESHLSTSPWQIMTFDAEQHYKAALIEEAYELHNIVLPNPIEVFTDNQQYGYRNKLEFSWYSELDQASGQDSLDLAFFHRGSKGKITVEGSCLAYPEIAQLARTIRDLLRSKNVSARQLKTLLIRANQKGQCVWQLYLKEEIVDIITEKEASDLPAIGGEIIYSNPQSPASVITKRLAAFDETALCDKILGLDFRYATEGFFQINLPVYQQALEDMQQWILKDTKVVDMYAGVGSIGLAIGGPDVTLVEVNEAAVSEMQRNIKQLDIEARAVLAASEEAIDYITNDKTIILDPPRAGLHPKVIDRLLAEKPKRIIYLSCNPVTQARDVALLSEKYGIRYHKGYNFFPRTPHIEHLTVLDLKT